MKKWEDLSDHPMSPKQFMTPSQYDKIREEWLRHQWDRWSMFFAGFCTPIVIVGFYILFTKILPKL